MVRIRHAPPTPAALRTPSKEGGESAADREPRAARPLSVLYIEDNPINVILVQELAALRPGVVELHCAEDGRSGVAAAVRHRPDLVLIDMQLPDFDGFEVMRRLRAEPALAGQVRIALSANSLSEDIARARAAGFDDYWTKPIDFKQFLAGLDHIVERLRANEARPSD